MRRGHSEPTNKLEPNRITNQHSRDKQTTYRHRHSSNITHLQQTQQIKTPNPKSSGLGTEFDLSYFLHFSRVVLLLSVGAARRRGEMKFMKKKVALRLIQTPNCSTLTLANNLQ